MKVTWFETLALNTNTNQEKDTGKFPTIPTFLVIFPTFYEIHFTHLEANAQFLQKKRNIE
jgi:hypothetical protein